MNNKLIHIEFLRTLALFCVIVFHTVGMVKDKIPHFTSIAIMPSFMSVSALFVGIAVPLFMFISGYLYRPVEKSQILSLIKKKALRLWLPYFIWTILIMLTSRFFDPAQIWKGDFYHLWFLPALFWCFIISIWIDYSSTKAVFILPVALVCSLICVPPFLGIQNLVQWYFYFAFGAICRNHAKIERYCEKYYIIIPLILLYLGVNIFVPFHYRQPSIIHAIAILAIILVIWNYSKMLNIKGRGFLSIGKYSLGIYILHFWILIYILSSTSFRIFHIPDMIQKSPLIVISVIVVVTFGISYIVTTLLCRNKWGRLSIGYK